MNKKDTNDDWEPTFDSVVLNSPDLTKDKVEWFKEEFERCAKLRDIGIAESNWYVKFDTNEFISDEDIWAAFEDYYENKRSFINELKKWWLLIPYGVKKWAWRGLLLLFGYWILKFLNIGILFGFDNFLVS